MAPPITEASSPPLSLYSFVSPAFDTWERPMLKSYVSEPTVPRIGPPWLDTELLRHLPRHVPTEDHQLRLSPAHEARDGPSVRA